MRESHAFRGHALEPGSGVACAAVRRKAFISEVIGHDEDDIRPSGGWRAGPGSGQENLQGKGAGKTEACYSGHRAGEADERAPCVGEARERRSSGGGCTLKRRTAALAGR